MGIKCWNLISDDNHHVPWMNLVSGLQEHFLKMTFGRTRSLTHQVLFFLSKLVHSLENYSKRENLFPRFFENTHIFSEVPNPLTRLFGKAVLHFQRQVLLPIGRVGTVARNVFFYQLNSFS